MGPDLRAARVVVSSVGALAGVLAATLAAEPVELPAGMPAVHEIRPGPGVSRVVDLSHYLPSLANTPGDTRVFVLEGALPGGTALVVGGTHANEIGGAAAATLLVERAKVTRGRLLVLPHANNSAVTLVDPERPCPPRLTVATESGTRTFLCGARLTNPLHQGAPDPSARRSGRSELPLFGHDARNLDRAYPGRADGTLTERVAYAIVELLRRERVDLAFDLHEAPPGSRLAWTLIAHPRALDLAAAAAVELDGAGLPLTLEVSRTGFRGLSHREWGDATDALAFLIETPNPNMVKGKRRPHPIDDPHLPLAVRVGSQLQAVVAVLEAYDAGVPAERGVRLAGVPGRSELVARGLGAFLN